MPQLAANWNDKRLVCHSPSLIDLKTLKYGQQGGTSYEDDRERLSERALPISLVAKRSDSPNPIINIWKQRVQNLKFFLLLAKDFSKI